MTSHGHCGTPAITFSSPEEGSATFTKEYVDEAADMFGIDLSKNLWLIGMHPTQNYPIRFDDPDPDSDMFLIIAPRIRSDE